jgi:hypothetical protein
LPQWTRTTLPTIESIQFDGGDEFSHSSLRRLKDAH